MILVRFACDHEPIEIADAIDAPPRCPVCSNDAVRRTWAMAPRFKGICTGPSATYAPLEGIGVNIASAGPLFTNPKGSDHAPDRS